MVGARPLGYSRRVTHEETLDAKTHLDDRRRRRAWRRPPHRRRAGAREAQGLDRRRRQEPALLPAAHDRRAAAATSRPKAWTSRSSDFAGGARALQAVVGGSADVVSRRLRAHHQHAGQEPVHPAPSCCRAARRRSCSACRPRPCRTTRRIADLKGKKIGVSAPGSSTNMVANFVLSRGGLKASDVSFIGVGTAAGALAALRSGQIDAISNTRPGDDDAGAEGRREDHQRHAHAQGHDRGLRRPDAGGLPLRVARTSSQKNPNTCQALTNAIVRGLKWLQTAGPGDIIKTVPERLSARRPRALPRLLQQGARSASSPDGLMPERGRRDGAAARWRASTRAVKAEQDRPGEDATPTTSRSAPRTKFKA